MPLGIDLCCGLGGASSAWRERGWNVLTLDYDPQFHAACGIIGGATHENFFESMRGWHHNCINPKKRWTGQVITEKICARYDPRLMCYYTDTTPVDPSIKLDLMAKSMAITPNEIRKFYGYEPYQFGGDDPINPRTGLPIPIGTGQPPSPAMLQTYAAMRPAVPPDQPAEDEKPKIPVPSRNGVHRKQISARN
jgi:hypothetical protein